MKQCNAYSFRACRVFVAIGKNIHFLPISVKVVFESTCVLCSVIQTFKNTFIINRYMRTRLAPFCRSNRQSPAVFKYHINATFGGLY